MRIDEGYLIGDWLGSALWGLYTVIFVSALSSVYQAHRSGLRAINWVTTATMIISYALATAYIALALKRLLVAFIQIDGAQATVQYMADIGQPLNRAKNLIYITSLIVADCILVWRYYIVWGRRVYITMFPGIMVLITSISGYAAVGQYFRWHPDLDTTLKWGTAAYSVSLATNIIVTSLIVGRILWMKRMISGPGFGSSNRLYRQTLLLVIESGLVITIAKIIEFILFRIAWTDTTGTKSGLYVMFEIMPQISGAVPTVTIAAVNGRLVGHYNNSSVSRHSMGGPIDFGGRARSQSDRLQIMVNKSWDQSPGTADRAESVELGGLSGKASPED